MNNIKSPLAILACYRSSSYPALDLEQWDSIIRNSLKYQNCLLVGVFNAHNQAWNCTATDNGLNLLDSSDKHNLFVLNPDTNTHVDGATCNESNIDLLITPTKSTTFTDTTVMKALSPSPWKTPWLGPFPNFV